MRCISPPPASLQWRHPSWHPAPAWCRGRTVQPASVPLHGEPVRMPPGVWPCLGLGVLWLGIHSTAWQFCPGVVSGVQGLLALPILVAHAHGMFGGADTAHAGQAKRRMGPRGLKRAAPPTRSSLPPGAVMTEEEAVQGARTQGAGRWCVSCVASSAQRRGEQECCVVRGGGEGGMCACHGARRHEATQPHCLLV